MLVWLYIQVPRQILLVSSFLSWTLTFILQTDLWLQDRQLWCENLKGREFSYWEIFIRDAKGLPSSGKLPSTLVPELPETWVRSLDWEDPQGTTWHPFQYSCLGNPMDRGAWWAVVHGGSEESDRTKIAVTKGCQGWPRCRIKETLF